MHVQAGHLRAAQDRLLACAQPLCDRFIRRQCTQRYSDIEPEVPSVIPLVNESVGKPLAGVRVTVDDDASDWPADGRAIPVDPGRHQLHLHQPRRSHCSRGCRHLARATQPSNRADRQNAVHSAAGRSGRPKLGIDGPALPPGARKVSNDGAAERKGHCPIARTDIAAPRQAQRVGRDAHPLDRSCRTPSGGWAWRWPGSGALFTYWGRVDNEQLSLCSPACPQSSVDHVHRLYIGADVAFGVGAALIAAATWAYSHQRGRPRETSFDTALRLDVHPTSSGAMAALRGRF